MLTIVMLLTGDVQEARMVRAYLQENYPGEEYERILVYCGEDAEAVTFLDQDPSAVLFDGRGAGIAASCNAALRHASGREILFSAAPYVLVPAALRSMKRAADGSGGVSLVVPMLRDPVGVDKAQELFKDERLPYRDAEGMGLFAEELSANPDVSFVSAVLKFCFLAQRQVLLDMGGFSEEFHTTPFLMLDICLRFWQADRPCIVACGAFAHENPFELFYDAQDDARFTQKYGLSYPYSFIPRTELLEHMDLQKDGLNVLEVGCACGATLLAIRNANPKAEVYGIEFDKKAAEMARHFSVVEALDVETLDRPEWHETFDYIILGDVIEHLHEPQRAMKNLALLLKPSGCVLVSTPNVMHFSVFRMMLAGRWKYEEAGILDRTHLRFFTRTDLLALLEAAGLEPQEVFESREETEHDQAFIAQLAALLAPGVDPEELHAFQWKVVAKKR